MKKIFGMKTRFNYILSLLFCVCLAACHDHEEVWNQIPQPIVNFIEAYWPGTYARSYNQAKDGTISVDIAYGPGLTFTHDYGWISVDGYGEPLPQQFLFDCMPQNLYRYLEETEATDRVFSAERNARTYELVLLDQNLTYTIATGEIRSTPTTPTSPA